MRTLSHKIFSFGHTSLYSMSWLTLRSYFSVDGGVGIESM